MGTITEMATLKGTGNYPFEIKVEDYAEPSNGLDVFQISLPTYGPPPRYFDRGNVSSEDLTGVK